MKSMKIMGLCLVAAFLVSAVAVATASAATPTFLFGTGGGGKPQFSSVSGPGKLVAKVGAEGKSIVECTSDRDTGEVVPGTDRVRNVLVIYDGCTAVFEGSSAKIPCSSTGQGKELIKTNQLEGDLGYAKATAPVEVGLVLKPQAPAELFAEFECEEGAIKNKVRVKGEVIGKITPVNVLVGPGETTKHFTLEYVKGANVWEQGLTSLEVLGKRETGLLLLAKIGGEAAEFEFSGLETTDEVFPLESITISA
jgi:hypothetical protein